MARLTATALLLLLVALLGAACAVSAVSPPEEQSSSSSVGCVSESGHSVDWWAIIKYPYLPDSSDPTAASGYGYMYADATTPTFKPTGKQLNTDGTSGALAQTLAPIYTASNSTTAKMLYNDEHPDGKDFDSFAHMKGGMAFTSSGGFWLIHSVPRFPPNPALDTYTYPQEETKYGQSFLCLSLSTSTLNEVGSLMLIDKPSVFYSNLPSSLGNAAPNVASVLNEQWVKGAANTSHVITTTGGTQFLVFAKNADWAQDLYEDMVAPALGENLSVESWQNGVGPLPSYCRPKYAYDVCNVKQVTVSSTIQWSETEDHSKWAVSVASSTTKAASATFACIGDINRQQGQEGRGGGTACLNSDTMWKSMSGLVTQVDGC